MKHSPITAEVVNALLAPIFDVLKASTGIDSRVAGLDLASRLPPPPCVMVRVELRGSIVGLISWSFDPTVARELAARMLSSPSLPEFGSVDCTDALTELSNVIVGNATGALLNAGYVVQVLPPTSRVMRAQPTSLLAERALAVILETPVGKVNIIMELTIAA
jgi:CheY-specific phosphatase CheX